MSHPCPTDGSFGPTVGSCRGGFDFTLLFEESILGLLPQAAFLLLAPLRLVTLRRRRSRIAKGGHLGTLKFISSVLYAASSIVLLVLWSDVAQFRTRASIAAATVELLGSVMIGVLSRLEHTRAIRPSHLLQFFLLTMLACDAVHLRTLCLMDYPSSFIVSTSMHTTLAALMLLLESLGKTDLLSNSHAKSVPPEQAMGLFETRLFIWLNKLFQQGYRKVLTPQDLLSVDDSLLSGDVRSEFRQSWTRYPKKTGRYALLRVLLTVLRKEFLLPCIPRLLTTGTEIAQPFLIAAMISFIGRPDSEQTRNMGYGLIGAFALDYTLLAVFSSWHAQGVAKFNVKLRGCLISAIYHKALEIPSTDINLSAATVLMNVEVEKVVNGFKFVHDIWALAISSAVASYILYTYLGVSFLAPLLATLAAVLATLLISKNVKVRQAAWGTATGVRVSQFAQTAGNMKGIRMLGLVQVVQNTLADLRAKELVKYRYGQLLVWVLAICSLFQIATLFAYLVFAIIGLSTGQLTMKFEDLFASLSALKLVTTPMLFVLQHIQVVQNGVASAQAIQKYLQKESQPDALQENDASTLTFGHESDSIEMRPLRNDTGKEERQYAVQIKSANFGFEHGRPLLTSINLKLRTGALTIVIGQIASGKSMLLRSLAGETTLLQGAIDRPPGGMGFCSQTPWLRNLSLRENIIGESEFDERWYTTVTWACGLDVDFAELDRGDATLVGSRGVSLSGGQKNRLSLARALYSRRPVMLIDDVLSGLDNTTEKLVFERVFGRRGVLRKSGTTVILATHSTRVVSEADEIVVMANGSILEQGTYSGLRTKADFIREIKVQENEHSKAEGGDEDHESTNSPRSKHRACRDASGNDQNEEETDQTRRTGDIQSLLYFLRVVGRTTLTCYFILQSVSVILSTMQFIWLKMWAESTDGSRSSAVKNLAIFVVITIASIAATSLWIAQFVFAFLLRASSALHSNLLQSWMNAAYSFIASTDVGSITNRFSQDILLVDSQLPYSWSNTTDAIGLILANFGILIAATPPVAAIMPILGAIAWMIQRIYLRTSRQVRLMDIEAKAPLCTHFLETLEGLSTIRTFGWLDSYKRQNTELLNRSQVPYYLLFSIQNWLKLVLELMIAGVAIVVVGSATALRSSIDPGYLGLALVNIMDLGIEMRQLVTAWTDLETSLGAIVRIRRFVLTTPPEEDPGIPKAEPPASWPSSGSVEYRGVIARYSESGEDVLRGIDLRIRPGEKVGICGRTGSGKSSLVATLFGLLKVADGEVAIDGIPLSSIPLEVLRAKVTALPQDSVFLRGSVRYNLAPWISETSSSPTPLPSLHRSNVPDSKLVQALQGVGLWNRLAAAAGEDKDEAAVLDWEMKDVDSVLSHGERQLFCLARAIVMDGRIVVLDEATSSVDTQTEKRMQNILRSAFGDRTVLAIAHRLESILDFDRIVVMDTGRIVEVGEPETLMATQGSLFKTLVEAQRKK
ncbi:P-loop containing nucleoside triphosphate hydrolase protein [Lineolata rhizophorae]|uniref:P-loop containing nucleoside triphosphate hydrolase protein n=1 Tax=Lineolata rhizophorae TaxID=578093 RepID=A0A6A6NX23_9PEZI|nr:P-loop containing nucleoside triphosphate hydrolase protein [Lineolata rhizophorae]